MLQASYCRNSIASPGGRNLFSQIKLSFFAQPAHFGWVQQVAGLLRNSTDWKVTVVNLSYLPNFRDCGFKSVGSGTCSRQFTDT